MFPSTTISQPQLDIHIRRRREGSMVCLDAIRGDAAQQLQFLKQSVGREIAKGNYVDPTSYH